MVGLSRTSRYTIETAVCLACGTCPTRSLADISRCAGIPRPYLAKIVGKLVRAGLVTAKRGAHGGVRLVREPAAISVGELLEAIEGKPWIAPDLFAKERRRNAPLPRAELVWRQLRNRLLAAAQETTVAEIGAPLRRALSPPRPR